MKHKVFTRQKEPGRWYMHIQCHCCHNSYGLLKWCTNKGVRMLLPKKKKHWEALKFRAPLFKYWDMKVCGHHGNSKKGYQNMANQFFGCLKDGGRFMNGKKIIYLPYCRMTLQREPFRVSRKKKKLRRRRKICPYRGAGQMFQLWCLLSEKSLWVSFVASCYHRLDDIFTFHRGSQLNIWYSW